MRLAHLHLPGIIPFSQASTLQQTLVNRLLSYKKHKSDPSVTPPDPTIFTFSPNPVYTTGRRDFIPPPSASPVTTALPSRLLLPPSLEPIRHVVTGSPPLAEFHPALRGGQTTYHGPGQLVIYTILDLAAFRIGPRAHISLLEDCVLDVLAGYGLQRGMKTEDPGIWVKRQDRLGEGDGQGELLPRKIAAVGVHLRRYVSSYGVGLNVTQQPMWFFQQIVACGLKGRETTSLEGEGVDVGGVEMGDVANRFVNAFVRRVSDGLPSGGQGPKIDDMYRINVEDVSKMNAGHVI
ncbi:hypothetical protein FQN57_005645 [Myotisia sp. PD_48]|nr:hypothetical protein FQN57_005645 [Myotisia sp. PD_48]